MTAESLETVIIGAGPSGLAAAGALQARGHTAVVLEAADAVGSLWRRHYDRLHLHTVKKHSALPGLPYPAETPKYVPRGQFVDYLERYAEHFGIRPRFGVRVLGLRREGEQTEVTTTEGPLRAKNVVVASGYNRIPKIPEWPGQSDFGGEIVHSRAYRNGDPYAGQTVLVVGIGNTGGEIAIDLWERGARPIICVRGPVHVVPREFMGRSAQESSLLLSRFPEPIADALTEFIGKYVMPDVSDLGLQRPKVSVRKQVLEQGKIPLIDIGTIDLIRQGAIKVVPGIESFTHDGVQVADGRLIKCDAVVLATGYRPALEQLLPSDHSLLDDRGYPRVHGTPNPDWPGLYFLGFANPITGALREAGLEAVRIAQHITGG